MVQDNSPGNPPDPSDNPLQALIQKVRSGQLPLPLIGGLAALVVVGIILVAVALGSGGGGSDNDDDTSADHGGLQTEQPTPEATIDLNRPTAVPGHLTSIGAEDRLVISRFGVDAPLTYRAVPPTGVMPNPDGPDDIAYYDFTAFENLGGAPGLGGNAVFAGHVDSGSKACKNGTEPPPCRAVLWDLNDLNLGDEIEVHVGGVVYKYAVTSNEPVNATSGPWEKIVTSTAEESITIITCGGDFNRETREYTNRQVVTAVRIA
jgi:LPXTG-site transpeptidase (sortase) family protein